MIAQLPPPRLVADQAKACVLEMAKPTPKKIFFNMSDLLKE